jgi:hypothetical protein
MHRGVLAMQDTLDQKTYEVRFDPARTQARNDFAVGSARCGKGKGLIEQ